MGGKALKKSDVEKKFKENLEGIREEEFREVMDAVLANSEAQNSILLGVH